MKCLAVFNSLPDLSYLWVDDEFKQHLCKTAVKIGLVDPAMDISTVDEESLIMYAGQFFSPLVTSNKYMREKNNSYQTMICENGFIISMNQLVELSDLYFVALCGDGEESELFLQRKISFFHRLLWFLYGPCADDHLKPPFQQKRKETWRNLDDWLQTWHALCQQEQMFLVEALERLHVNQELNNISLKLLGEVLTKTNKDGNIMHALIIVNNKLLGLYSSERSIELKTSDILLLIVLIKKKFRYNDDLVPKSIYRTPPALANKNLLILDDKTLFTTKSALSSPKLVNKILGVDPDETDSTHSSNFHSAPSTPPQTLPIVSEISQDKFYTPQDSSIQEDFDLVMNDSNHETISKSLENIVDKDFPSLFMHREYPSSEGSSNDKSRTDTPTSQTPVNELESERSTPSTTSETSQNSDIHPNGKIDNNQKAEDDTQKDLIIHENIFLQYSDGTCAPYSAHCVFLGKSTMLVMLSQHKQMYLAFFIQNLLRCLSMMLKLTNRKLQSYRLKLLEDSEKSVQKIQTFFFRNAATQNERMAKCFKNFEQSWQSAQTCGLVEFINSDTVSVEMPQELETRLTTLLKNTKILFTHFFIYTSPQQHNLLERQRDLSSTIRKLVTKRLSDYESFLYVRGQQNVTMTAYHNDFPALVHFMYINRTKDHLIAPTVNVNVDSNDTIYVLIKQRLWDYWQYSEVMVSKGYSGFIVRDGDFSFSYFLWFEDSFGKPMLSQKPLKDLNENKPTGILSGHFYKNVIHYLFPNEPNVNCYELLTIHVGLVSNKFIAASCRKLIRMLWEGCGEANSPVILL